MVDGAIGLFATMPVDEVTVQDIANAVGMTPAAVYYHFASKEQILTEAMTQFRDALLDEIRANMPGRGDPRGIEQLVAHLVAWAAKRRPAATVYFVSSIGLNLVVEALRRETRAQMIEVLSEAVRSARGARVASSEAGVIAVGLVSLLETALASMLNQDATYRALGARRFGSEVAATAGRIAGV